MTFAVAVLLSVLLAVAPGAWFAFVLLDRSVGYTARLALAVALSPFVLGLQIIVLTRLGLDFHGASLAALLNAFALPLLWSKRPALLPPAPVLAPAVCFLAMAGGMIALWILFPDFRIYSWHNMMQGEAVYQAALLPRAPEDMGLAGVPLGYNWFGHIQVAVIGRLADASPFVVFPILNVLAFFAMFALLLSAVNALRPGHANAAAFTVTTALLTTNLAGVVLTYVVGPTGISDIRVVTLVQKFFHFDLMTNGEALFAGMIFLGIAVTQGFTWPAWLLLWLCAVAISFTYALLFPSALVLAGCMLAAPVALHLWAHGELRTARHTWLAGVTLIAAVLLFFVQMKLLSLGGGNRIHPASLGSATAAIVLWIKTYILWLPFLAAAAWRIWRRPEPYRAGLFASAAALAALGVAARMPVATQYKFLVASLFCSLPLVAEQALIWLEKLKSAATPIAAAVAAVAFGIMAPYCVRELVPWRHLPNAIAIDDRHFDITTADSAALRWTRAIRDLTPPETVMVTPPVLAPVTLLSRRAELIARDPPDVPRPGYSMSSDVILGDVKAYPRRILDERDGIARAIYGEGESVEAKAVTEKLRALGRPVAVYFPGDGAYLAWLRESAVGREIYRGPDGVVIVIHPAT
jgi:hypothetical protein